MHCGLKYRERTQSVVSHSVTSKIHRFKMKKTINSPSWHNKMSFFLWEKKITSWKMPIQWKCHLDILKKILFCVWQRKKKKRFGWDLHFLMNHPFNIWKKNSSSQKTCTAMVLKFIINDLLFSICLCSPEYSVMMLWICALYWTPSWHRAPVAAVSADDLVTVYWKAVGVVKVVLALVTVLEISLDFSNPFLSSGQPRKSEKPQC